MAWIRCGLGRIATRSFTSYQKQLTKGAISRYFKLTKATKVLRLWELKVFPFLS